MKSKIVTTAAAALIAGLAGLTLATQASAAFPNLAGLCSAVRGGLINSGGQTRFSGWKKAPCASILVSTNNHARPVRAVGAARFNKYNWKSANVSNIRKCRKSVVIVRLYVRAGGTWRLLQTRRARAKATLQGIFIKRCSVEVVTGYANGSNAYRAVVFAVDGGGGAKGVLVGASIRTNQG